MYIADNYLTNEKGITKTMMSLKTSSGINRMGEIQTGFKNVDEYSKYLQEKYSYMNKGTTYMQKIPTTVTVSDAFLKKCMNDPEKAAYLEENLAAVPDCMKSLEKYTKMMPGSPVCTYCSISIGDDGNITMMSGCTNDPDGKIARENAEKKAKEKKEFEEKLAEKRKERDEQLKNLQYISTEDDIEINITGRSIESILKKMEDIIGNGSYYMRDNIISSFDFKA